MSDEVKAGQEPPTNPPSVQADQESPTPSPQAPAVETFDKAYVESLRRSDAAGRKAQQELEAIKKSQLTEAERIKQEAADANARATQAEQRARSLELTNHLLVKAPEYGIKQNAVPLVMKAIDQNTLYGDDGTLDPPALKKALEGILRDVPELGSVAESSAPGSNAGGTNVARPVRSRLTREQIEKMSAAEINARYGEIQEFLKSQNG